MKPFTRIMRPYDGSAPGMPVVKRKRTPKGKAAGGGKRQRRQDNLDLMLAATSRIPEPVRNLPQITIPWPGTELWPNRQKGRSWHYSHAAKRAQVDATATACIDMALHRLTVADGPIRVLFTACPPTGARFDKDGISGALKAAQDTIARALGVDDSRFDPIVERGERCANGAVIVNIEVIQNA